MTSRYRVEYHLKSHRRDEFIEWIKGLLVVPFVLVRELPFTFANGHNQENLLRDRYANVFSDVEGLIEDHITHQDENTPLQSKLKMLVPTIGIFFTPLPLRQAFLTTEPQRAISQRRYVAPSFNGTCPLGIINKDIRRLLATAQLLAVTNSSSPETKLKLITFDGDVTLYPDGSTLLPENPVIPHLLNLLSQGIHIGIVTAAGYPDRNGTEYTRRLEGLLNAVAQSSLTPEQKDHLAIVGGECNYIFRYNGVTDRLEWVDEKTWKLDEMEAWEMKDIETLLDIAEEALHDCAQSMRLKCQIVRKQRAVGLVPKKSKLTRECLEEAVLACQRTLSHHPVSKKIPFCCFNGGSDVWIDVGDKSLGVSVLQRYFHNSTTNEEEIWGGNTLHVGDQFMSLGGNDFKARKACTTAWVANPGETVELLEELLGYLGGKKEVDVFGAVAEV